MIKAVVFDFDGVFTDDKVIVDENGKESVVCSRSDGYGILQLKKLPIRLLVLTKEVNPVASHRCNKMGIECKQGIDDKLAYLSEWLGQHNISPEDTIYVGNDVNDIACMQYVGESFCPIDSHPKVLDIADDVLYTCGGNGAVRELCDLILEGL